MKSKLFILHPGKANYPDIDAYKSYFKDSYEVIDGTLSDYEKITDKSNVILWCIMGFYVNKLEAKFIIHDYRSLSVGKFKRFKDFLKNKLNCKPDLRIFLNQRVKQVMSFNDSIPSCLLDMGVPDWIFEIEPAKDIKGTFCYIGEMSLERGFDKVLDSFLNNRSKNQTFVLVGTPEPAIVDKYKDQKSLNFTGRVPQKRALEIVKACDFAVCFFPYHRPHCYQTPTKLLEYAALGMNIICNDSPSNMLTLKELKITAVITDALIFNDLNLEGTRYANESIIESLNWKAVIENSNIEKFI